MPITMTSFPAITTRRAGMETGDILLAVVISLNWLGLVEVVWGGVKSMLDLGSASSRLVETLRKEEKCEELGIV
jgi:hypothetical protein